MPLADHSSSDLPIFQYLAVNHFSPIHSFPCRPPLCSFSMVPYYSILQVLVLALGAASLSIEPASFSFAVQYNNLLNYTSAINQTNRAYNIKCSDLSRPDLPILDPAVCREVIPAACEKLSPHFPFAVKRNEWVWTSLEGCWLAYYMPREAPRFLFPSVNECKRQIYGAMIDKCTQTMDQYNLGTINVEIPPDTAGEGSPLQSGYPRYLMASKELDE